MISPRVAPFVASVVERHRAAVQAVLDRMDDRLLVVAGPRVVHDAGTGLDYAGQLAEAAARCTRQLLVVLDARLVTRDVAAAHEFALEAMRIGLPLAARVGDLAPAPHLAAYALTGPRTAATYRFALPVGCESGADGDIADAVGALRQAAASRLAPLGPARAERRTHLVLRCAPHRPEHDPDATTAALTRLRTAGLPARLAVSASGGDPQRQRGVVASVARQVGDGQGGIVGVVIPSSVHEEGGAAVRRGAATTSPCLGLPDTVSALDALAIAVERRRIRDR
ncbi:DAHP synthetase I family protein [Saccharothrix syringae]|uniref:3-deoxy-D-arabino-heptulosonate 7-phosphate synthase n=1 Tax=Saccharothrix syringae TaxID=103733 RepID=A0A5Q0GXB1_SACSY|nr:hypothetical protein [Saccharothrix syringae]QFZ18598.1 hypothetical protein EKG83_15025 [Saccharothrix syringae]